MKKNKRVKILVNFLNFTNLFGERWDEDHFLDSLKRKYFIEFKKIPISGKKITGTLVRPMNEKAIKLKKVHCFLTKDKTWVFTKEKKNKKTKVYFSTLKGAKFEES